MNRLQSRVHTFLHQAKKTTRKPIPDKPLTLDFPHRLFTPEHYEKNYAYPLLIWLHSHDSSEYELDSVMPHVSLRNYVAIAIRGPHASPSNERRFQWGSTHTCTAVAEELVLQAIDSASEKLSINRSKVFLAGHGAGGTMAQWIGLRHSQRVAGVVSIHGGFPRRSKSLVQWKLARKLPVLFMYGEQSELCDTDEVCRSLQHAHSAGLKYRFSQFPASDELDTAMADTANRFMMELVTGQPDSSMQAAIPQELENDSLR
jgi:phospholipase/carboxylesterase